MRAIATSGRKVALIGVENAYPVGTDLTRIKEFHDRGGRYMSLAHNGHSQFADSNTGERDGKWLHNGLSELGKQADRRDEPLGHHGRRLASLEAGQPAGDGARRRRRSSPRTRPRARVANHSRNLDDEQLQALKKNGGVIRRWPSTAT